MPQIRRAESCLLVAKEVQRKSHPRFEIPFCNVVLECVRHVDARRQQSQLHEIPAV